MENKLTMKKMKNLIKWILITLLYVNLLLLVFSFGGKSYCDGWKTGYVRGYCGTDIYCIKPIVPICPVPLPNFNTYQDGYDRGFKAGKKKADE
jgi:hypothetical protein